MAVVSNRVKDKEEAESIVADDWLLLDGLTNGVRKFDPKKFALDTDIPSPNGINVKSYGALGDGTTDDTPAFQDALDAGGVVHVPKSSSFYRLTARLSAPANTHIILESGAELRWTSTTANGSPFLGTTPTRPGIEVSDNFTLSGSGKLTGPSTASYLADEGAIYSRGSSTTSRRSGLHITDVEITNWGSYGIFARFVDNITISRLYIHHCGYAGSMFLSSSHGAVHGNRFDTFTPGTASNAFGLSLGNHSEDYDSDPNAATNGRLAANPFCIDWDISHNLSENIPLWCGLDSHGGYGIRFHHNIVHNCKHGIHLACGSGDASAYAGEDNAIESNTIDSRKHDGTAGAAPNTGIGINICGTPSPTVRQRRVRVSGNFVYGYGLVSDPGDTASIGASFASAVTIFSNIIEGWGGVAISISDTPDAIVLGNIFRQLTNPGDAFGCAIRNQTATAVRQSVIGNIIDANGATAAHEGFRTAATLRPILIGNDFTAAVTAVILSVGSLGYDLPVSTNINLGAAGGTTVLNLSEFDYGVPEITVRLTASAPITITNITGVPALTRVTLLIDAGSSTITFSRATSALGGSADFAGGAYDTLSLMCYLTSGGVQWVELARSVNG